MMEYEEFGRSGTAPSKGSKGTAPSQRTRPKTRGVATGAGASELADLNMSLKMDKGNGAGNGGHYDISDDPIEDFQSAVESWERARRTRPSSGRDTSRATTNTRTSNSAYTKSDPVSAAYSSQFRTATKTATNKGSPRASLNTKSKAVAELHVAYGIGELSNQSRGGRPRSTTPTPTHRPSSTSMATNDSTSNRPASRGNLRSSTAGTTRRKDPPMSQPPTPACSADSSDVPTSEPTTNSQHRATSNKSTRATSAYGTIGNKTTMAGTSTGQDTAPNQAPYYNLPSQKKYPPSDIDTSSSKPASDTSGSGTATKWYTGPPPPRTAQPPPSPSAQATGASAAGATEGPFRRRKDFRRVTSAGRASPVQREGGANDGACSSSSSNCKVSCSATPGVTVNATSCTSGAGVDMISSCRQDVEGDEDKSPVLEVDIEGVDITESSYVTKASTFADSELQRPQSRKLYLGSTRTPTNATSNRTTAEGQGSEGGGGDGTMRAAPRSVGGISRHRMSPELLVQAGGRGTEVMLEEGRRATSKETYGPTSTRWKDASVDYDNRPPSRQRSAFPTHLADMDTAMSSKGSRDKKHAFADIVTSDRDLPSPHDGAHVAAGTATGAGSSPRSTRGTALTGAGEYSDRPPSRQKLCAQNLFDTDNNSTTYDTTGPHKVSADNVMEVVKPEPKRAALGFASPLLSPTESSISLGIIDIGDAADSIGTSPPPRAPRTAFDASSLGPMNDPTADGFTQLDRSTTAPFKIRVSGILICVY